MPGAHKGKSLADRFQLGAQKVVDIKLLEFQVGFFDKVWTVVSAQKKSSSGVTVNGLLVLIVIKKGVRRKKRSS
jgi:hypothetical protein